MRPKPRGNQREFIQNTEGIYLVDAGAGTGKTFAISRRYAELLDRGTSPEQIFLATFTESGAENMKDEIVRYCDHDLAELRRAPISTFHGFCQKLLSREGFEAPKALGLDERLSATTKTLSNELHEEREFANFYSRFQQLRPKYEDFYRIVYRDSNLLRLVKSLAAKGIFPKKEGWFRKSEEQLKGDWLEYQKKVDEANAPRAGKQRKRQSRLLARLSGIGNKTFLSSEVEGKQDVKAGKQVDPQILKEAFWEDRKELIGFLHDLYFEYINYSLGRNYLNFSFQLMFAYVMLMEDDRLRSSSQFDYVMIDEFQDTNEIQFKLSLLLSQTGNIAAVGDWKQSIFGFQFASVENITSFRKRLGNYYREINEDRKRVPYELTEVNKIPLKYNFRSSQKILDFSESALQVPGKKGEDVQLRQEIVSLKAAEDKDSTEISAFKSDKEVEAVLSKLVQVVESGDYKIDGESVDYNQVAIFSRNRSFARRLDKKARMLGIPLAYEGGAEIFKTDPGILLLAWLRVLQQVDSRRGWSVILEEAGYNIKEAELVLDNKDYPESMFDFREKLQGAYDIGTIARTVFVRYGIDNPFTDKIIEVLQETFESSFMSLGDVIGFLEENIESGETYEVDSAREEAATVQTIHAAKGLEYPVVILANMNRHTFPSTNLNQKTIFYDDIVGLRNKKIYSHEEGFIYDNLKAYISTKVSGIDYSEERRLLYVAMTRAKNFLFFSAEKGKEGRFFEELDLDPELVDTTEVTLEVTAKDKEKKELKIEGPKTTRPRKRAVHSVVDISSVERASGRGTKFGDEIHRFAETVALGKGGKPPFTGRGIKDKANVYEFITSLEGKLYPEQEVLVPSYEGGQKLVYHGSIDLLHLRKDEVDVVDFKTDESRSLESQYVKQLQLYKQAVTGEYPKRKVNGIIFYTKNGLSVEV